MKPTKEQLDEVAYSILQAKKDFYKQCPLYPEYWQRIKNIGLAESWMNIAKAAIETWERIKKERV